MRKLKRQMRARLALAAIALPAIIPALASAQVIYSDNFNSASDAANYNINITPTATGGPSSDATFGYDYSQLGIPSAPGTTDGSTLGLRLRVDNLGSSASTGGIVLGAVEVATKNLTLPSQYVVSFDLWGNYIGGTSLSASGSNGSTAPGAGIGTTGTTLQSPNANNGLIVDTFHDGGGGANTDYRVYTDNTRVDPSTSTDFAAGKSSTAGTHTNPYYNFLTSHTAPGVQTTGSPSTQGGSTPVGIIAFQWTQWTIIQDGTDVTWEINGHVIATVPDSSFTQAGDQVSLDEYDSGLTGSSVAANQLYNADIFDNFTISDYNAPDQASTLALFGMGLSTLGMFVRRKK